MAICMSIGLVACGSGEEKLQAYAEKVQNEIEASGMVSGDQMDISITAEDNVLIYTYVLKDVPEDSDLEAIQESIEKGLEAQESTYVDMLPQIKKESQVKDVMLRLDYVTIDGDKIFTKEYK